MTNMKPTAREVKVILSSIGLKLPNYIFNDKRVNGGRIKLWVFQMAIGDMSRMRVMLQQLFPHLEITVERFKTSTVIKWNNEEEQPTHHMPPFGGTYADELPSQRHDW
tara:strand:+ start:616 stop:939 length:324 start_codon:yes stop_codon:yes gene_type:complete